MHGVVGTPGNVRFSQELEAKMRKQREKQVVYKVEVDWED